MKADIVRTANQSDEPFIVSTLVMAFSSDPAARWSFPDPHQYLTHFPSFVRAFGGKAFAHGSAHIVDGCAAVALWLPPDIHPDQEELGRLIQRSAPEEIRDDLLAVIEQMSSYHPSEPHWFLPLIGVDGPAQGRGYGSALLDHALAVCDRDQIPAYLESSNPKNVPLYQRHGFELLGTIQVGTSPQIFPMLRKPSLKPAAN
ncbi:MAG: GNAT family N-acetyltransferase [Bryobacteraceae bacterium]